MARQVRRPLLPKDITKIRENLGLSQETFAYRLRIPLASLEAYERGTEYPSVREDAAIRNLVYEPLSALGVRLIRHDALGLSQKEFAIRIHISLARLRKLERGIESPTRDEARRIRFLLEVEPGDEEE